MSFGLRNAAQTFQRFMDQILEHLDFSFAYIYDILSFGPSPQENVQQLHQLQNYGILLNPIQCP
jgi:hypothetical protein